MSTVGVVIPAYNAERWLTLTLDTVKSQTFSDWSCVIVDDGSTDATLPMARAYVGRDDRFKVVTQRNRGLSGARNAALGRLSGVEYLAFLDSDDLWLPNTLALLVGAARGRPDAVGAYGLAELVDEHGARIRPGDHPAVQRDRRRYIGGRWRGHLMAVSPSEDLELSELVVANPFWPPATGIVRRSALEAVGGFDESYRLQEDWQMWLRLAEQGPFVAIDTVTAEYRRHTSNLTGDWARNYLHQDRLRKEASRRRTLTGAPGLVLGAWRHELRVGVRSEASIALAAARRGDVRAVRSALVRVVWNLVAAWMPGGPITGARLVRWRPRTDGDSVSAA